MAEELRGWKEIGGHFGTSERTAQRWEREHGMPVHRTGRTRGSSVFAFVDELNAWRRSPAGERAGSENGDAVLAGEASQSLRLPHFSRLVIVLAGVLLLIIVIVAGWAMYRRHSTLQPAGEIREAYAVPKSSLVFLLKVTREGSPFVFHVLDGGMATLTVRGGVELGFVPTRIGTASEISIVRITEEDSAQRIHELKRVGLNLRSPMHFDYPGMIVDIEWIESLRSSDLPPAPVGKPRECCIACIHDPTGTAITACAAQVSAPACNGDCCGFEDCKDAKKSGN